ncbi:ParA family protein [Palleronia caenipelagi]|uniref:Chromosome partitioning protein ParA n=1 Tax=Palleronia caenipelagi TaxID=2489174 RepID=A0A547Q930_9RHOB|nr:ParA family protein [Palleronia caenipelagi]TRD22896.1 ParA family protein [Palleronia caenipelagi]
MSQHDKSAPRIVAIANQKGGVGKTTTAINLGAGLALKGHKTLVIDLDPQGNASTGLGVEPDQRVLTTYDLLLEGKTLADTMVSTEIENLYVVPSTADLSSADLELHSRSRRASLLDNILAHSSTREQGLDFILIDCPPSLSLLTVNAMVAADAVLVPLQSEFFALEGLSQLMMTIREIRQTANPDLAIEGVLLTMYDGRNRLAQAVMNDARETLGDLVYNTIIPRNVRISEAPSHAQTIHQYDPSSKGSVAYMRLVHEFLERNNVTGGVHA